MQQALHVKAERAIHVHQTRVDQIARAHARTRARIRMRGRSRSGHVYAEQLLQSTR
jgi:hypothetical protein